MDQKKFFRGVYVVSLLILACLALFTYAFRADIVALARGHPILLGIAILLVCLDIAALVIGLQQGQSSSYVAGLIATATLLPGAATLITVVVYLAGTAGKFALLWGSVVSVEVWLGVACVCRGFGKAGTVVTSSYNEIRQRLDQLSAAFDAHKEVCSNGFKNDLCETTAHKEAEKQIGKIHADLEHVGPSWVLATGYAGVWERLYRAEEALIEIAPQGTVLSGAVYDYSRLQGSNITTRDELLAKLEQAVAVIDPSAKRYLKSSATVTKPLVVTTPSPLTNGLANGDYPPQQLTADGGTPPYSWFVEPGDIPEGLSLSTAGLLSGKPSAAQNVVILTVRVTDSAQRMAEKLLRLTIKPQPPLPQTATEPAAPANNPLAVTTIPASPGATDPPPSPTCNTDPIKLARAVLRTVRRSINESRNESWNGLILARNHLLETMICAGLTLFVLLAIVMIWGAPRRTVFAASVFYLVGAIAGLSDRLRRESQAEAAIKDYGLSTARLVTIPLFSGLGAVGGVMLMAVLPFLPSVFGPRTSAPPPPSQLAISTASPLTEGEVAKAYSQPLQATGGTQPYKWTVSEGAIPDALDLSPAGVLSGTPTIKGTGNFTVRIADSAGVAVEKRFALPIKELTQQTPLAIDTTWPLPGGSVGTPYSERLQAVGGTPPYRWKVTGGEKPAGLELDENTGVLHGMPAQAKTFSFEAQVKDSTDASPPTRPFTVAISKSEQAPAVSAAAKPPSDQIPSLVKIFDLDENLIGLLVAAVFGLTPGLLFERLQQQADKFKADLKNSQATEGTQKT